MPSGPPHYFLIENGETTGPHSPAVLRQKAQIHVITRDTPIAFEDAPGTWMPLHQLEVLNAELFPEKPRFTLASRPVETVNHAGIPAPASVDEILRTNLVHQRHAEGELLKPHPPGSNKRRNDYFILVGGLNGIVAIRLLQGSPVYDPFLVGLFVMGNISLLWVMFVVMDRY